MSHLPPFRSSHLFLSSPRSMTFYGALWRSMPPLTSFNTISSSSSFIQFPWFGLRLICFARFSLIVGSRRVFNIPTWSVDTNQSVLNLPLFVRNIISLTGFWNFNGRFVLFVRLHLMRQHDNISYRIGTYFEQDLKKKIFWNISIGFVSHFNWMVPSWFSDHRLNFKKMNRSIRPFPPPPPHPTPISSCVPGIQSTSENKQTRFSLLLLDYCH